MTLKEEFSPRPREHWLKSTNTPKKVSIKGKNKSIFYNRDTLNPKE